MIDRIPIKLIKDYLKTIISSPNWSIGASDKNKEESITIYGNRREIARISEFRNLQTYSIIPITILIRWSKNYQKAEDKANSIYNLLSNNSFFIGEYECFINIIGEGPIDLGADEKGIYKFSIEANIYYKKAKGGHING